LPNSLSLRTQNQKNKPKILSLIPQFFIFLLSYIQKPNRLERVRLMENLISLVNKIQRACTALGDHGEESALPTLWDALPAIAVVGGQVTLTLFISVFFF
jgi:hypothetical protein